MQAEADRIRRRHTYLNQEIETIDQQLKTSYQTDLTVDRVIQACKQASQTLDEANDNEWRALLRELGFKVILQRRGEPHIIQLSLPIDEASPFVLQRS